MDQSDTERTNMCLMYWETDQAGEFSYPVSVIAKKFGETSHTINKKVKNFCVAYATEVTCITCSAPYEYKNRADYKSRYGTTHYKCDECIAEENREEERSKQEMLNSQLRSRQKYPFSIEQLTFSDAVYLLSILRYQASEDLRYLKPYSSNQTEILSPKHSYDMEIYRSLLRENIIAVSPKTSVEDISIGEEEGSFQYNMEMVFWEVLIDESEYPTTAIFIDKLEQKLSSMEWSDDWYDEAKELCRDVCVQESIAYLEMVMSDHQFHFSAGEKTVLVLTKILEEHSVAQLYSLIWGAAKDAASYYLRGNIPKMQAANSVIGGIERKFERYVTNGWEIKPFRRNFKLPMSVLSQVLFVTTLHTDDGGFNKPLNKIV